MILRVVKIAMIEILRNGGVGVIPTDTLYGVVGLALNRGTVEKIYKLKKRNPLKPFIILVNDPKDLRLFGINLSEKLKTKLQSYWPGPVSIILECHDPKFEYLHRGTNSLAFRQPAKPDLLELLKETGPLVAPSANPEGLPPANNINEAKIYFGNQVDFYMTGQVTLKPSKIIKITEAGEQIIRS